MSTTIDPSRVEIMIPADEIAERVRQLAAQISADYAGKQPLVVGVLKGAWVLMADLVRQLTIPVRCDFVRVTSYGMGTETSGRPKLLLDVLEPVSGADVLVVDDILDTGISVAWLLDHLRKKNPASLRLCVLLDKSERRRVPVQADYVGFPIPDRFVVGYGLDCGEQFRELPFVGHVKGDE
ncbi:MAG TPA: hypoxanthine phosphoribosyltransferase [Candidatus Anammoximicrobium sp.]|nr:hypoxanthine phosphoribosyltransferase [Candidatus Anammoximicrobium sp.]